MNADTLTLSLKNGLVSLIQGLNLQGDQDGFGIGSKVYSLLADDESNVEYPNVTVTTAGEMERPFGGDSNFQWTQYPVQVLIRDNESARQLDREGDYQEWRRAIKKAIHEKRNLVTVPDPFTCNWAEIEFLNQFQSRPVFQYIQTGLRVKFFIIEPR